MNKEKGFSLVEILVAVAIVAGVGLMVMKLTENMRGAENRSVGIMDARETLAEIRTILENEKFCRLSLVDPNGQEVTWRKSDIDDPSKDPGLPVELWTGNVEGTKRIRKMFYDGLEQGKTRIHSIRLFMNNTIGPEDYPSGIRTDLGTVRVTYSFQGTNPQGGQRTMSRDFLIYVNFKTNSSYESTILGCERDSIQTICESLNMDYNPESQRCLPPAEECDDWKVLAEGNWNGWKALACDRLDGGYIQSLIFGQTRTGETDQNSMKVKCCYSKKYHWSECSNPVELGGTSWWEGNKAISCVERPRGYIRKLELYQGNASGKDTNGMKVTCCYPN